MDSFFIQFWDEHMPESFVSLLSDLTDVSTAIPKMHCSVETSQLAVNGMLRTGCNRGMAAWSSAQAHFPCCVCALNILENSTDILVTLLEEECYT